MSEALSSLFHLTVCGAVTKEESSFRKEQMIAGEQPFAVWVNPSAALAVSFPGLFARFGLWVRVWVVSLTHTLTHCFSSESSTKNPQNLAVLGIFWSCWADSNCRPHPYQGCALPTELQQQMATRMGLEPTTSGVTGRRSNQLNYHAICIYERLPPLFVWQGQKDSNPRHSVLETDALPAELYPYMVGLQGLEPRTNRL